MSDLLIMLYTTYRPRSNSHNPTPRLDTRHPIQDTGIVLSTLLFLALREPVYIDLPLTWVLNPALPRNCTVSHDYDYSCFMLW